MRVDLRCGNVGVPKHLLDRAKVGPALEKMGGERVAEQVRVDALRLEAGLFGEPAEHEEDTGAREPAALGVEEELRPVPAVEVGPSAREVTAESFGGRPTEYCSVWISTPASVSPSFLASITPTALPSTNSR